MTTASPSAPAARFWACVPALLLVSLIGAQLLVLSRVLHDPAFATEEDYYRKAVDWDAQRARQRQSDALGWQALLSTDSSLEARLTRVRARLTDASGNALTGLRVSALGFHNARSAQTADAALKEVSRGDYAAELPSLRPGVWEFRLRAARGDDVHEQVFRLEVDAGGAPAAP